MLDLQGARLSPSGEEIFKEIRQTGCIDAREFDDLFARKAKEKGFILLYKEA